MSDHEVLRWRARRVAIGAVIAAPILIATALLESNLAGNTTAETLVLSSLAVCAALAGVVAAVAGRVGIPLAIAIALLVLAPLELLAVVVSLGDWNLS